MKSLTQNCRARGSAIHTSNLQPGAVTPYASVAPSSYRSGSRCRASQQYQLKLELSAAQLLPGPRIPKCASQRWVSNRCSPALPREPGTRRQVIRKRGGHGTLEGSCSLEFFLPKLGLQFVDQASRARHQPASAPARPIRQIKESHDSQDNCGNTLQDKKPTPSGKRPPMNSQ